MTEAVTNGSFNSGTFSGWTIHNGPLGYAPQITTEDKYDDSYSCYWANGMRSGGRISQIINVPVNEIDSASLEYKISSSGDGILQIVINYSDSTYIIINKTTKGDWTLADIKSLLAAGKTISEIVISGALTTGKIYVDAISILYTHVEPPSHNSTPMVVVRVSDVSILKSSLKGVIDAKWVDNDPWVRDEVPAGPIIEWNILGPEVVGYITTHNYISLHERLFETLITDSDKYPVTESGLKYRFSSNGEDFVITLKDNLGHSYYCYFYNVRITTIQLMPTSSSGEKEAVWKINFVADLVEYNTEGAN